MKKTVIGMLIIFLASTSFAQEWNCKFFGNLELIVLENRLAEMTKEEQIDLVKKLSMSPREAVVSHMIVEDAYTLDINTPVSIIKERGVKICESVR